MQNSRPAGAPEAFEAIVEPYLALEGVTGALLASADGLIIAVTGTTARDAEALAANCATVLAAAGNIANEAGARQPRLVTVELDGRGLILAPLGRELFLIITGNSGILSLAGSRDRLQGL